MALALSSRASHVCEAQVPSPAPMQVAVTPSGAPMQAAEAPSAGPTAAEDKTCSSETKAYEASGSGASACGGCEAGYLPGKRHGPDVLRVEAGHVRLRLRVRRPSATASRRGCRR
jgi:hypothetical protein